MIYILTGLLIVLCLFIGMLVGATLLIHAIVEGEGSPVETQILVNELIEKGEVKEIR